MAALAGRNFCRTEADVRRSATVEARDGGWEDIAAATRVHSCTHTIVIRVLCVRQGQRLLSGRD